MANDTTTPEVLENTTTPAVTDQLEKDNTEELKAKLATAESKIEEEGLARLDAEERAEKAEKELKELKASKTKDVKVETVKTKTYTVEKTVAKLDKKGEVVHDDNGNVVYERKSFERTVKAK